MADATAMLRLVQHAADRLDQCDPMVNAKEVRRISMDFNTIEAAYRRAYADGVAIATAIATLRMVAAAMSTNVEEQPALPTGGD